MRGGEGPFGIDLRVGVDEAIPALDPVQAGPDGLDRRQLAPAVEMQELDGAQGRGVALGHGPRLCWSPHPKAALDCR